MKFLTGNKSSNLHITIGIMLCIFVLGVASSVLSQEDDAVPNVSQSSRSAEDMIVRFSSQLEQRPIQAIKAMVSAITVNPDHTCLILKTTLGFVPAQKVGEVVAAAIEAAPEQLATIISCAVSAVPEEISTIVRAGIIAAPERVGIVVSAAVGAAPTFAAEVIQAAIGAAPGEVVDIVTVAVETAPQEAANIVGAAIAAAPEQATAIVATAVAAAPAFSSEIVQAALDAAASIDGVSPIGVGGASPIVNLEVERPPSTSPSLSGNGGIGDDRPSDSIRQDDLITSTPPPASLFQ
jgi:hypothetical protein